MNSIELHPHEPAGDGQFPWREPSSEWKQALPALAVIVVAMTATAAALLVTRHEESAISAIDPPASVNTRQLGAAAACANCGVVESVRAQGPYGHYTIRVRMDDGVMRVVEQRGAVSPG